MVQSVALLCACGQGADRPPTVTAPPRQPATAEPAQPPPAATPASGRLKAVSVVEGANKRGVAATINHVDPQNQKSFVATTDSQGRAAVDVPCMASDRFGVEPRLPGYLAVDPQPCAESITFTIYTAQATEELLRVADGAFASGNFSLAQHNYALAAERWEADDPAAATKALSKARVAAGRAVGIERPTTEINGVETFKPETITRVKHLQRQLGLPESGELDEATHREISKLDVATVRKLATPQG
jgi:hypothetical protein